MLNPVYDMPKAIPTPLPSEQQATAQVSLRDQKYQPQVLPYQPPQFPSGLEFKETGLVFTRDLSKDEWKQVGVALKGMGKAWLWWIGDWVLYGEKMFSVTDEQRQGDKINRARMGYGMAIEIGNLTGYSPSFISSIKGVCQRVQLSWRSPNLTMHHAREILLAVPDAQFPYWAHRVISENLTTREVRIELRKSLRTELPSPSTSRPTLFSQEHVEFVRKFMAESDKWTEGEWQAHAAWHEPILKAFRSRGL